MKQLDKNQAGFSAIETLLIIAILGVVGGAGWWVYSQRAQSNSYKPIDPLLTPNDSPIHRDDIYADWKTYNSQSKHFSFKYPKDWTTSEYTSSIGNGTDDTVTTVGLASPELKISNSLINSIDKLPKGAVIKVLVSADKNFEGLDKYLKDGSISPEAVIKNTVKTKVDGNDAAWFDFEGIGTSTNVLFHKNDLTYSIEYPNNDSTDFQKYKKVYDEVVSSFKTN